MVHSTKMPRWDFGDDCEIRLGVSNKSEDKKYDK